jgi:hypothetical protein
MGKLDCIVTNRRISLPKDEFNKIIMDISSNDSYKLSEIVQQIRNKYYSTISAKDMKQEDLNLHIEDMVRTTVNKIDNDEVINSNAIQPLYHSQYYYRHLTTLKKIAYLALNQLYGSSEVKKKLLLARTLPNIEVHLIDKIDRTDRQKC